MDKIEALVALFACLVFAITPGEAFVPILHKGITRGCFLQISEERGCITNLNAAAIEFDGSLDVERTYTLTDEETDPNFAWRAGSTVGLPTPA
jgi:hypothetical protein